jgi:hypothetical protein
MMHKLVSIFVCGVQKGGTTSLHGHLTEHSALSSPKRKETHFFDNERLDWTRPDYSILEAFFPHDDGERKRFDSTPIYAFWPPSIARIRAYNPAAKLIFLFRDPFDRAWSHWCMQYARGLETLPFAEAIRQGRQRMTDRSPLASEWRAYTYIERGLYGDQVRRSLTHFPRESVLFLKSNDLRNNHRVTLARIAAFLDITPFPDTGPKREHVRPQIALPSVPSEADRLLITHAVRDDLQDFAVLTGLDISDWATMR